MPKKKIRPQFHCPDLEKAVDTHAPRVEGFLADQNALSQDILNLEKFLGENGVCVPACVLVASPVVTASLREVWTEPPGNHAGGSAESFLCSGDELVRETETLEWSQVESDGRWRLRYRHTREHGIQEMPPDGPIPEPLWYGNLEVLQCRPLIETPVAIRVKARPALPLLLAAVTALVSHGLPMPAVTP